MIQALRVAAVLLAGAMLAPSSAAAQAPAHHSAPSSADRRLKALYDGCAAWSAKEGCVFEDEHGDTKPLDCLPRVDVATQLRQAAHLKQLLDQLNAIPRAQLSTDEQVNA